MDHHRDIAPISVSIDLVAGRRGVDMGPSALRIAGIAREIEAAGHGITELGTVTAGGLEATDAGKREPRFLNEIVHVAEETRKLVCEKAWCAEGLLSLELNPVLDHRNQTAELVASALDAAIPWNFPAGRSLADLRY